MKKNIALIAGVAAFVPLFYKQEVALNASIFCTIVWILLFRVSRKKHHTKTFWWLSVTLFATIFCFAWYGDFASFLTMFFTLMLLIIKTHYPRLTILAHPFVIIISGASSWVRALFVKTWLKVPKGLYNSFWKKTIAYVIIPVVFATIFVVLYSLISKKFASYLVTDFNYNNLLIIILLAIVGFFFMFNFMYVYVPRFLMKENYRLSDDFVPSVRSSSNDNHPQSLFHRTSGEITLLLLNLLLSFFISVYAPESIQKLRPDDSYSHEVHERIYVLIASIVLAVSVIMIYFYSPSNFSKKGKRLRILSYVWIFLNAIVVVIALHKTNEYVFHYGLTFKRVGVYIFLFLCLAGLFLTTRKLFFTKTNIYLLHRMAWVFFISMIIGLNINWSWIVTRYNMTYQVEPDMQYLRSLDYNKEILYKALGNYHQWDSEYHSISEEVRHQKSKHFLSQRLYYLSLDIE